MRFKIELFFGKLIIWFINRIAPHKGTSFPGKFINRLDEKFLGQFRGMDFDKVVFITGTNGKSTMTNLLYHILKKQLRCRCQLRRGKPKMRGCHNADEKRHVFRASQRRIFSFRNR